MHSKRRESADNSTCKKRTGERRSVTLFCEALVYIEQDSMQTLQAILCIACAYIAYVKSSKKALDSRIMIFMHILTA